MPLVFQLHHTVAPVVTFPVRLNLKTEVQVATDLCC